MKISGSDPVVNMHDAKSNLSKLVDKAAKGETVLIGKAGKPVARLVAFRKQKLTRIGFLKGPEMKVPSAEVFDALGKDEIESMFPA